MCVLLAGSGLLSLLPAALGAVSIDDVQPPNNTASISNPYLPMDANISGTETSMVGVDTSTEWLAGTLDNNTIIGSGGTLQLRRIDRDDFAGSGAPDSTLWDFANNATESGGLLTLSSDSANGLLRPFVRMNASQGGYDLSTMTGLSAEASVTFITSTASTATYGLGFWDGAGEFFGVLLSTNGTNTTQMLIRFAWCVNHFTCATSGVTLSDPMGTPEKVRVTIANGTTSLITAERFNNSIGAWDSIGNLTGAFAAYRGPWMVFSGNTENLAVGTDFVLVVNYIALNIVLYPLAGIYESAPLNTGLFPAARLFLVNLTTNTGNMTGVGALMWRYAANSTGPWSAYVPATVNTPMDAGASTWIQFLLTLTRATPQSWPDAVSFEVGYNTQVGAYALDDFPNGPSGTINTDTWNASSSATFGEGLDLDSASSSPSIGVTYKNASWDLSKPQSAEGVVAVRVENGSSVASGGAGDSNVLLTGFLNMNGSVQTDYIGVVRTSAGGVPYWGVSVNVTGGAPSGGPCALLPVDLRSAATYAVLGGSTVTNTGPTAVTGDLGVSPGTAVTGFPPGTISGATNAGNTASATAIGDLGTAYTDAAGRTLCPVSVAGNLGGQTLAPGLYKSTSSLAISSGDLTLDAKGDPNAVWIFQMASTLTTTSGRQVILAGGAQASNIFWQVGSSATLGTTSVFHGTIMADQSVTLETGATLDGRALAHIAAVSLDSNVVTVPSSSGGSGTPGVVFNPVNVDMTDGAALIRFELIDGVFHAWVLEEDHAWRGWLDLGPFTWGGSMGTAVWRIGDTGAHPGAQHAVVDWAALLLKWMTPSTAPTYSASQVSLNENENTRAVIAYSGSTWDLKVVTYRLDTVPPVGDFIINGASGYSNRLTAQLALNATDKWGVSFYAASESLSFPEGWKPYSTTPVDFFLSPGDGRKVVWVRYMDSSGQMSAPVSHDVYLDTVNPSGAIYINNRAKSTNTHDVTLTILGFDAGGVDHVGVSNDASYSCVQPLNLSCSFATQTNFDMKAGGVSGPASTINVPWTLAADDGERTVYAIVYDIHGRSSVSALALNTSVLYSSNIKVDTQPPNFNAVLTGSNTVGGTIYVNDSHIVLQVSASDASGISEIQVSEDPTFADNQSFTQAGPIPYDLPHVSGPHTLYLRAIDIYGLTSPTTSINFTVDVTAPTGSVDITYTGQTLSDCQAGIASTETPSTTLAKGRAVVLTLNATDNLGVAGVAKYEVSTSLYFPGASWNAYVPGQKVCIELSPGDDQSKTVYVRYQDVNGNPSQAFVDRIAMDTSRPTGSIIINNGDQSTSDPVLTLSLEAYDNFPGDLQMRFSLTPDFSNSTWLPWTDTYRFPSGTQNGNVTVYYQIMDANGWTSLTYSDFIRVAPAAQATGTGGGSPGFDGAFALLAIVGVAGVALLGRRRKAL